jgi:hypothetical protein
MGKFKIVTPGSMSGWVAKLVFFALPIAFKHAEVKTMSLKNGKLTILMSKHFFHHDYSYTKLYLYPY